MYKIFSVGFCVLLLTSCSCLRDKCGGSSKVKDAEYNECRDRLGKDGVLTDKDGRVLVPDRTFFAYDRYDLSPTSKKTLKDQSAWMAANPDTSVTITGHCDERGTREYNIGLGERRATAARDYLVAQGTSPSRFTVISKGKDDPIVLGSTEAAWAQNRVAIISKS